MMLKKNWICLMVALWAMGAGSAEANFADDMEAGIGFWGVAGSDFTVLSTEAMNGPSAAGVQSLSIENTSPNGVVGGALSNGVPGVYFDLLPNTEYTFSFDYYGYDADVYFALYSFVTIEFGGGPDSSTMADFVSSYEGYAWNSWVPVSITRTTGPNVDKGYLGFFPASGDKTILIDNISLQAPSIAGDFDSDGDVDGADFILWQGDVNVGDLADWQTNYGAPSAVSSAVAVPEPASASLLVMALGALALVGCRRKSIQLR